MGTYICTWHVCAAYLDDWLAQAPRDEIHTDLCNQLKGWVRSRSVDKLSKCALLFDEALHNIETLRLLMQVAAFFKKNAVFASEEACQATAKANFLRAEKRCKIANKRLDYYYANRDRLDPELSLWLTRMEADFRRTLGPFSMKENRGGGTESFLNRLPTLIRVTSGATATSTRRRSLPFLKIKARIEASSGAQPWIRAIAKYFGYDSIDFRTVNWNRVEFVTKNWETHRTIACEAAGNLPLQLAIDAWVKERLRRFHGIDLSSQTKNQRLATLGSLFGFIATVDVKEASDSYALNAFHWLTPAGWDKFMLSIRAPLYKFAGKGESYKYEKFSSMGNGTTFVLETLLFASACKAVGSKYYTAYGDDIVIESSLVPKLTKLLAFLGFRINDTKTHTEGSFRESCGVNMFDGMDVTPFYIRKQPSGKPELAHLINGLAGISSPYGKLRRYLKELTSLHRIIVVPYSEDSQAGVWIDPTSAYSEGLIKHGRSDKNYGWTIARRYEYQTRKRRVKSIRTLFLWHLETFRQKPIRKDPYEQRATITSLVPTDSVKYRVRWASWSKGQGDTPVHLYQWAEELLDYIRENGDLRKQVGKLNKRPYRT